MSIDYIGKYADNTAGELGISSVIGNGNDNKRLAVSFLAFLTSFNDSMTSNWNEEQVYGRPDPIGTFQNTTRKISLAFDVPSKDLNEAKENLKKINKVKQMMYPAYSSSIKPASEESPEVTTNALSLAKPPLVRLFFTNLIQDQSAKRGLLGWIGSFSANPVIDMGMFHENGKLYPKVYNATIDFTPQHEFDLGFNTSDGKGINSGSFASFPYGG